jgi:hypothetical protein
MFPRIIKSGTTVQFEEMTGATTREREGNSKPRTPCKTVMHDARKSWTLQQHRVSGVIGRPWVQLPLSAPKFHPFKIKELTVQAADALPILSPFESNISATRSTATRCESGIACV